MPTETVYGLAASISSEIGLRKIFSLKERPFFDPLIVHVSGLRMAQSLVQEWTPVADYLARSFWPGALTLVLRKAESVNPLITSGLATVALRFPSHPMAQALIKHTGVALAAPSANKFGRTSPTTAAHVRSEFPQAELMIIDGGPCQIGVESTVLSIENDQVQILRHGGITEEALRESLRKFSKPVTLSHAVTPASPGHLEHHYMPQIPLVLVNSSTTEFLNQVQAKLNLTPKNIQELKLSNDPRQAARELYSEMRRLSEPPADLSICRLDAAQTSQEWAAIRDRLNRAATLKL